MSRKRALKVLLGTAGLIAFLISSEQANAQADTVLYSFAGKPDGDNPNGGLAQDGQGNVYGTTEMGGQFNLGTIFRVTSKNVETVLHSFSGTTDGSLPLAGLLAHDGKLYGTTSGGGAFGSGTVFKLSPSGMTTLYSFTGGSDGAYPYASVIFDKQGNLYSTTSGGGTYNFGTVFKLSPSGVQTVLYSFSGGADGANPSASLILDGQGNLYGTAGGGLDCPQESCGVVFKITQSGTETVLHSFANDAMDGIFPSSGLVRDGRGNLYGTTWQGGIYDEGTLYRVTPSGTETVLVDFVKSDLGYFPSGNLLLSVNGIYGTTYYSAYSPCSCGAVYKVDSSGEYLLLHDFTLSPDGNFPNGALILGFGGFLYGTTQAGGTSNKGTVFKVNR